jgi:hypothetical protein
MPLIKFKKPGSNEEHAPESPEVIAQREAVNESIVAAKKCLATPEFKTLKQELAKASERTIDLLIQIDEQELDADKFSVRVRNILHKVKFLRSIEAIVEKQSGEK